MVAVMVVAGAPVVVVVGPVVIVVAVDVVVGASVVRGTSAQLMSAASPCCTVSSEACESAAPVPGARFGPIA